MLKGLKYMAITSNVSFCASPSKSFDVFSQQVLKNIKRGENANLKEFTSRLTSFSDTFEVDKSGMNKKSKKFAETLVGLNKDNLASIVYSFLIKVNRGNIDLIEEFATNALKIAKRLKDPLHIMARANDLREAYKIVPPKNEKFMSVLYDEKHALKDIISNYEKVQKQNKNLKPKENYQILLAEVKCDIAKRQSDKNLAKQELLEAKELYETLGLKEKAQSITL